MKNISSAMQLVVRLKIVFMFRILIQIPKKVELSLYIFSTTLDLKAYYR